MYPASSENGNGPIHQPIKKELSVTMFGAKIYFVADVMYI